MQKFKNFRRFIYTNRLLLKYRPYGKLYKDPMIVYFDSESGISNTGGLADRLKGLLGIYAYCKLNNYVFKLVFDKPFELSRYLTPNYNWLIDRKHVSKNIFYSKPVYLGKCSNDKQKELLAYKGKQMHVFLNSNWSMFIKEGSFKIGDLFDELFIPNSEIQKFIILSKQRHGSWNCLVFRFQNLLDDFNEPQKLQHKNFILNDLEKTRLINLCYDFVKKEAMDEMLLITSDSKIFLENVKGTKNTIIIPGNVIHMAHTSERDYTLHLKAFLDFLMISESKTIRSVGTNFMYPTNFPKLAAELREKSFERVILDW